MLLHHPFRAQIDNRHVHPLIFDLSNSVDGAKQLFDFLDQTPSAYKLSQPPWLLGIPMLGPGAKGWYWEDSIT
jgi:hypothetical protein